LIRVSGSCGSKTYYFSVRQHECSCFRGFLSLNPLLWRKRSGTNIAGMCHMGLYICFCILSVPIIYPFFLRVKPPHPFRLTGTHPLHRLLRPFSAQKSTAKETDHFLRRVLMLIVLKGAQVSLSGSGLLSLLLAFQLRPMEVVMNQADQTLMPVSVAHQQHIFSHLHAHHAAHHLGHAAERNIVDEQQV